MDLKHIIQLIEKVNETELGEIKIEQGDFKIAIRSKAYTEAIKNGKVVMQSSAAIPAGVKVPQATPVAQIANASNTESNGSAETTKPEVAAGAELSTIKAPMIGTFYRSAGPDKEPFKKVGDTINVGDTICIIEAMKLFNEIEAETSGKIVKILIDDASPVEYDQPVFLIEPA